MQTLIEEWVFGFAHQVRNPLGIIRSVAESLLESKPKGAERDSLMAILKAVDGLHHRLKEFIEFSKPVNPLVRPLDLHTALQEAIDLARALPAAKGVDIKPTFPPSGTRVEMDPDHVRTILFQLLKNACEAMPQGGRVAVEVLNPAGALEIRVRDEGAGISREHIKEIGRPFFTTKPNAVGLGLALIKRILRAYHGTIDIDSKPGRTTTIVCRIPLRGSQEERWAA
jgi:signal transduction histidine kinase